MNLPTRRQQIRKTAPDPARRWLKWPSGHHIEASIIGDGIAGACLARQLAELGLKVSLFGNQQGSSHNIPQLLVRAYPEKAPSPSHRLYQCAFEQANGFYQRYCPEQYQTQMLMTPQGLQQIGSLNARAAIETLKQHSNIEYRQLTVRDIQAGPENSWQLFDQQGQISHCNVLVLCTAHVPAGLELALPLSPCSGQVIHIDSKLQQGFADGIHALPLGPQTQIGSSYRPGESDSHLRASESANLLHQASQLCQDIDAQSVILASYAANRISSYDHLPVIGPSPNLKAWAEIQLRHENQRNAEKKPQAPLLANLWLNIAHGSRGATMAPLAAQLLGAALQNSPIPLSVELLDAIHPGRFATRETRRTAASKS